MIINNPPLPVLGRNDVLSLSKDNERMYRDSKKTDLLFYAAFLKKIDELLKTNNKKYDVLFGASVKKNITNALSERKQTAFDRFSLSGILRNAVAPKSGGLLDAVVTGLEQKREQKKQDKQERKDFNEAFMRTNAGRKLNIRPDDVRKSELDKEFKLFKELRNAEQNKQIEISKQEEQKNKFGLGGPTKKSYSELEQIQKAIRLNQDRISGVKQDSPSSKVVDVISTGSEKEQANESGEVFKDMLKSLVSIESILLEKIQPEKTDMKIPESKGIFDKMGDLFTGLIGGMFGKSLKSLLSFVFNPKNLLKVITKFALPVVIVSSIVNGVIDGFKEWQKSGSIKEAVIAGLGGILDFITFGLIDKEDLRKSFEFVSDKFNNLVSWVSSNILDPMVTNVINPITNFYSGIYKEITEFVKKYILPGFGIGQFVDFIDKEVNIAKQKYESAKPIPNIKDRAEIVRKQILDNRDTKKESVNQSNVIAPTVVNSSTTKINIPKNVRNSESTFNRYISR